MIVMKTHSGLIQQTNAVQVLRQPWCQHTYHWEQDIFPEEILRHKLRIISKVSWEEKHTVNVITLIYLTDTFKSRTCKCKLVQDTTLQ